MAYDPLSAFDCAMAHPDQQDFFSRLKSFFAPKFLSAERVFEVGSQDINGTVRPLFPASAEYIGVDLGPAECVDWVIPGELVELSDGWADVVISTECFEHCKGWDRVFLNMVRILTSGGLFIFTSAGTGRATHGTIDSDQYSSPFTTSYYKNLDVDQVVDKIKLGSFFSSHGFEVNSKAGDLYFWGIRSDIPFDEIEDHWSAPLDRLARAQGQLAQAATRYKSMSLEASLARTEADQARAEVAQAKLEADRARAEIDLARLEADQARAESNNAKDQCNSLKQKLHEVYQSRTWRLTRPLRVTKDSLASMRIGKRLNRLAIPAFEEAASPASKEVDSALIDQLRLDGEVQAIRESGLFDEDYYLAMYPDIHPVPADPIQHYCQLGWIEGRDPSDSFDTCGYLDAYSDIRNAGLNPFYHYVVAGAAENRESNPNARGWFEDNACFGDIAHDLKIIAFYKNPDWKLFHEKNSLNFRLSIPHDDLGFYETSKVELLVKQAHLAAGHGVGAWCFELNPSTIPSADFALPLLLANPQIDIGFILDINLLSSRDLDAVKMLLISALLDRRYLQVSRRPVIVVTLAGGDETCSKCIKDLHFLVFETLGSHPYLLAKSEKSSSPLSPSLQVHFEAVLVDPIAVTSPKQAEFQNLNEDGVNIVPYSVVVSQAISSQVGESLPCYRLIRLGCDEISLRYSNCNILELRRYLDAVIADVRTSHALERRLVFVDSWNDWSRGSALEPDRLSGYAKLNEISRSVLGLSPCLLLPKVSVIVPNYNHAAFLNRRLDSIYSQTYKNFEVILLDDASQDGSREILRTYADKHSNISKAIFNQANSGGVFRQWSKGIAAATGDLIWIAESDDYCDSDFLEKLVCCFDDEAVMLAYAQTVFVNQDETLMPNEFEVYVRDLACKSKWAFSYTNTAHQEVSEALGIINTIPNASAAVFRRPVDMPLLNDETWLSMRVAGDWIFYLHQLRGGKIAYTIETSSYFRRYKGSAAESSYQKHEFYRELAAAAKYVQSLYAVPEPVIDQSIAHFKKNYDHHLGEGANLFHEWVDVPSILEARKDRTPNILISTQGFSPGGAEILPIRMANEFKRQGHSVTLLSSGLAKSEYGVRNMLQRDIPVIETSDVHEVKQIIRDFGIDILNSHQWHVQKYPCVVSEVFQGLRAHIASLHGMIEHSDAFGVTSRQLETADRNVTTWVYTADKNIVPFMDNHLFHSDSQRFVKLPNGMQPPLVSPINRLELGIPEDAFVFCCVSRAIPEKGWLEAIEAVTLAREISGLDIRLILVGNGPVYDELVRLSLPPFIFLAGFNENSVGFYAASQAGMMLTSFKSESFPLTIVDCLFSERPFIATSVGEIRNMLTTDTGLAGEVIELENWKVPVNKVAEAIVSLASSPAVYQAAKERACDAAKRYRIDLVVKQYLELIDRDVKRGVALDG